VNDLGGREYSDEIQEVVYNLSLALRTRDRDRGIKRGITPSSYMKFYVKAAAILVETAIRLAQQIPGKIKVKDISSWLKTLTGLNIVLTEDPETIISLEGGKKAIEGKAEAPV